MTEKDRAVELFMEGYNCAQSVFVPFAHCFGIDEDTAKRISAGLGAGVGRMREVCGSVSAAAMVIGSITAATEGADRMTKAKNYELVREFADRFKKEHGSIVCREILGLRPTIKESPMPDERTREYYKKRPCIRVIYTSASVLEDMLREYEKVEA